MVIGNYWCIYDDIKYIGQWKNKKHDIKNKKTLPMAMT